MRDGAANGHPADGRLLAHLDGELAVAEAGRVEEHLEGCDACRRRREELARASDLLTRELRAADVEPPPADALAVRRAARRREGGAGGRREGLAPSTFWKAAVLVLGVGAAASATVPGSPVEGWITDAVRALAGAFSDGPAQDASTADGPATASGAQGVSLRVAGRAEVRISEPAPGLVVRVRSVDDSVVSVVARGARYRVAEGVVEVVGPDGPDLRVELPTSAATARITAGGELLMERVDGRIRIHAPSADTADGTISFPVDGRGPGG